MPAAAALLEQVRLRNSPDPVSEVAHAANRAREDSTLEARETEYVIIAAPRGTIDEQALGELVEVANRSADRNPD